MNYSEKTLAQIVTELPVSASLLEKHDLDYCCKGKRTLKDACENMDKLEKVEDELKRLALALAASNVDLNPESLSNEELINLILNKHHHYVKETMPVIYAHLNKVASKHGGRHPELLKIFDRFEKVLEELNSHMLKEEKILFPAILELQTGTKSEFDSRDSKKLSTPIQVMELEHELVGDLMAEIKVLSNKYTAPADACMTYRLSFDELKEFEKDLHQHIHLENNILFPRVVFSDGVPQSVI